MIIIDLREAYACSVQGIAEMIVKQSTHVPLCLLPSVHTCFAPASPAMSFHDSEGLMSSTSDRTASRSFASSAVSFFLSGAGRCLATAVDCLSLRMVEVVKAGLLAR